MTLAVEGGPPALPPGRHRRWPQIGPADRAALERVLDRGELWGPHAPEVMALQREWAAYVGTRFCLMTNSGTAALHCALAAAGVGPGDEVIVPAFSFVATPMAVLHAGATPVFCDIDPLTHTIDPALIRPRARSRAIVPVHAHGLPAAMDAIRAIGRRHGLAVIEDAAQAHGATYRGARVGKLGVSAAFSLNGSKHLPAGEAGLFVTDDEQAFAAARRLAIFGEDVAPTGGPPRYRSYWSHGVGWNYRSSELVAALARSQLTRLDGWIATAQQNAALLSEGIERLPGLEPPHVPADRTCAFYRYRVRIRPAELGFEGPPLELRDRLLWALQAEGLAASLWQLLPLPAQPVFRRGGLDPWDRDAHPVAAALIESSIVLGTAEHPLWVQAKPLMHDYVRALGKVIARIDAVLRAPYRPVQPWPPIPRDPSRA